MTDDPVTGKQRKRNSAAIKQLFEASWGVVVVDGKQKVKSTRSAGICKAVEETTRITRIITFRPTFGMSTSAEVARDQSSEASDDNIDHSDIASSSATSTSITSSSVTSTGSSSWYGRNVLDVVSQLRGYCLDVTLFATKSSSAILAVPLWVISMLQILSFTMDPQVPWVAGDGAQKAFTEVVVSLRTLNRASGDQWSVHVCESLVFFFLAFCGTLLVVLLVIHHQRGDRGTLDGRVLRFLRTLVEICTKILYMPIMHCSLSLLTCQDPRFPVDSCMKSGRVAAGVLIVLCNVLALPSSAFQYIFLRVSNHPFACFLPYIELLHLAAMFVFSITYHVAPLIGPLQRAWIYLIQVEVMVYAISCMMLLCWMAPYYKWWSNYLKFGLFLSLGFSGTFGLAIAVSEHTHKQLFIVYWILCLLLAFGSFFFCKLFFFFTLLPTHRKLGRILRADREYSTAGTQLRTIREIRLCVLHVFWDILSKHNQKEILLDSINALFSNILSLSNETVENHRAEIETLYCLFCLEAGDDLTQVFLHLKRAIRAHPTTDIKILLSRLDDHRQLLVQSQGDSNEEIIAGCKEAQKHTKKAKELLCKFWQYLLNDSVEQMQQTLARFDSASHRAEGILKNLLVRCPKSTKVLREYALFLEEIRQDSLVAAMLYERADAIEESQAQSRARGGYHYHTGNIRLRASKRNQITPLGGADIKPQVGVEPEEHNADVTLRQHAECNVTKDTSVTFQDQGHDKDGTFEKEDIGDEARTLQHANAERTQKKYYQDKISQIKSTASWKIIASTIGTLCFVSLNITLMFFLVRRGLKIQEKCYSDMHVASTTRSMIPAAAFVVEDWIGHMSYGSEHLSAHPSLGLATIASNIDTLLQYWETHEWDIVSSDIWASSTHNISVWSQYTHTRQYSSESLKTILGSFERSLLSIQTSLLNASDAPFDPSVRYVLDNSRFGVSTAFDEVVELYYEESRQETRNSITILILILPISFCVVVTLSSILFLRPLLLLKKERENMLCLFFNIPRKAVVQIFVSYGGHLSSIDATSSGTDKEVKLRFNLSLFFKFLIGIATAMTFVIVLSVYGIVVLTTFNAPLGFSRYRLDEQTALTTAGSISMAVLNKDYTTFLDLQDLQRSLVDSNKHFREDRSKAHNISGDTSLDLICPEIELLVEHRDCTNLSTVGYCYGLSDLDNILLSSILLVSATPEINQPEHNLDLLTVHDILDTVWDWHSEMGQILVDYWLSRLQRSYTIVMTIFILSWPFVFGLYAVLHQPLQRIRAEHKNTLRMLLMVPGYVIDETLEIKGFLDTGKYGNYEERMKKMLFDSQKKTEQILQAAADAIVLYNTRSLKIEVFNMAAERMFGYTKDEIIGESVQILLHDGVPVSKDSSEMVAKHKSGNEFPVLLSKSETSSEEGDISALFIRDVRNIRAYQNLIDQNEILLFKILPQNIALRLKSQFAQSNTLSSQLIADYHESVTILFADIVKFSQWSCNVEPQTLVTLLNNLVCSWDVLAIKRKVEKIKTIGDCYMAVCGCPDPHSNHALAMVQFAINMTNALTIFNKMNKTNVQIRIGINSGSVVAGVIGLSKVIYDIWGPAVNLASRMESSGIPNTIQISETTYNLLDPDERPIFKPRGEIEVKGGEKVNTFLFTPLQSLVTSASPSPNIQPLLRSLSQPTEMSEEEEALLCGTQLSTQSLKKALSFTENS
ncbi:PAS domain S-box protein [Pelomyxa schiedti]|nr:PAS domain S-box protein [Pelomyxa schiedti]